MKKIAIIYLFIISVFVPAVYAYWTDTVNSEINITLTYDGYLHVVGIPEPVPVLEPELVPEDAALTEIDGEEISSEEPVIMEKENLDSGNSNKEDQQKNENVTKDENIVRDGNDEEDKQDKTENPPTDDVNAQNKENVQNNEDTQNNDAHKASSKDQPEVAANSESEGMQDNDAENND